MNFFEHQDRARRQSRRLVVLLVLAVIAMVAAIDGALLALLAAGRPPGMPLAQVAQDFSGLLLATGIGVLAVIVLASLFKSATLRSGGGAVARQLGGAPVPPDTQQPRLRRLRNVVEEIAIASGVPVPEVYVLEQEAGINAFAAGWSPADAAIAVTRGALEKLDRDELQGVIAHEFSHVLNGDMRLNIRLMGLLFGILVVAVVGREVFKASSRARGSRKNGGGLVLLALAVMAVGYIGLFFGRLIKSGVSRSREFLADSSAVQFTRQTRGIAGALKKLAGVHAGSRLAAAQAEEVSHMLFGDGIGYSALFATHPPLAERIRRLDPGFKPEQLKAAAAAWNAADYVADDPAADTAPVSKLVATRQTGVEPDVVARQVANPSGDDYLYAEAVHAAIPASLHQLAGAAPRPLVFALLLDAEDAVRQRQLSLVGQRAGAQAREQTEAAAAALRTASPAQRLPLAALAFPALRQQPREALVSFLGTVTLLTRADGHLALFEFCLGSLLRAQLADLLDPAQARVLGRRRLGHSLEAAAQLLGALAHLGSPDPQKAQRAFAAGQRHLPGRAALRYAPPADAPAALEKAFSELDELDAPGKQMLIEALVATLNHDRRVTVGEAELLRAVCGRLHCPLPPVLGPVLE